MSSSSSSSDDDSQAEVAALFHKSAMKQKQQQQQQTKRRFSSTSPPKNVAVGGQEQSSSPTATGALAASKQSGADADTDKSQNDDDNEEEDDDDDDDVAVSSGRATKRRKNKKTNVDNRLASLAQKRAIRERQLKVKLQQNWNDSDDDDSSDDEHGGGRAALTKSIDRGRIAINVETKVYDEDGNCCSSINQESTLPPTRTTRSTAAAAAAAASGAPSSSQPEIYELSDSSDDEKTAAARRRRPGVAAIDPATIVAAAQGTGVDASTLLEARQAMMKLQSHALDCDDDEDDDYDDEPSSLLHATLNAPPPRLLKLNVVATLENLDGGADEKKTVVISMLSNETFKGLKQNLLEQLSLPKSSSVTLRYQEHALYIGQTPDTISTIKSSASSGANNGEPTTNAIMDSGSTLHARIFGVPSKKAAASAVKKTASSALAAASTAANFGPTLTLTLRGKDGQSETFKLRQREPFSTLADAYRTKKNIPPSSRIILQFDGQALQMTQTPLQCDMETDDLIDAQVVN